MTTPEAIRAERDLNSYYLKQGTGRKSDSTVESGVDERVQKKFPDAGDVRTGPAAVPSSSDRKHIPPEEGGEYDARGHVTQARHFEGPDGPEEKAKIEWERRPGDDDTLTYQDLKKEGIIK
ncbi:hypothetical protein VTN00DRAFT_539 [Thermoascus crustaceus]|uniref:uncharacterized protein n=1 Tax=Thermoascus crustaceus TaxID=5088 RepID=UPI003742D3B1